MNPTIITVLNGVNAVFSAAPIAIDLALKIKALLSPQFTVTIQSIQSDALKAADETLALADQWERENPETK